MSVLEEIKLAGKNKITEMAAGAADTIKEEAVDAAMRAVGEDSTVKLDKEGERIVSLVYHEAKAEAEPILKDANLSVSVKVTKLLAALMKIMEKTKVDGSKIPGLKKKAVVLYLLRQLMKDVVDDLPVQSYLISKAEAIGESLLETLADISRNVNIPEVAATCCMGLISALTK
jgi:vacuolar-type H+-ATPase subunit H